MAFLVDRPTLPHAWLGGRPGERISNRLDTEIEWFTEPIPRNVATRDVSMKLLMAMVSREVPIGAVIDHQRVATMNALEGYMRLKAPADEDELAWLLHLDRLASRRKANCDGCHSPRTPLMTTCLSWLATRSGRIAGRRPA